MNRAHSRIKSIYSLYLPKLIIITACTLLSACATSTMPQANEKSTTTTPRYYHDQIAISGRISIQYQQNEQEQSVSGSFDWQQEKDIIGITLTSPLGQTIAVIKQTPQGAILEQAKQEPRTAPDIEQLLLETMGWSLPVGGLKNWLQGFDQMNGAIGAERISIPAIDNQTLDTQGWQLRFVSWQIEEGNGNTIHPKRIDLARHTNHLGEIRIRIVISEWKTP
jgi:outer membrane lipoprotein LolB